MSETTVLTFMRGCLHASRQFTSAIIGFQPREDNFEVCDLKDAPFIPEDYAPPIQGHPKRGRISKLSLRFCFIGIGYQMLKSKSNQHSNTSTGKTTKQMPHQTTKIAVKRMSFMIHTPMPNTTPNQRRTKERLTPHLQHRTKGARRNHLLVIRSKNIQEQEQNQKHQKEPSATRHGIF